MTRPIVVGYEGSAGAREALRWALDEAARAKVPVHLAYAFPPLTAGAGIAPGIVPGIGPSTGSGTWSDDVARREIETVLRDAVTAAAATHPELTVHGEVLDGPATPVLRERSADASLMVLGSRGHGGFTGLLTGSTTVAVCAHAHCPVVVVRPPQPASAAGAAPIVVGVDGSECSLLALEFAIERAANRPAPVRVLRAPVPPIGRRAPDRDPAEITRAEQARLDELLAGWRQRWPAVELTAEVVAGTPAEALVAASRTARLAVVGSRGLGGFRGLLLGSVSQQLMQHGECPVAVVRELPDAARPEQISRERS